MAAKTVEERIQAIDAKIEKKRAEIEALEAQKQKLLHPVTMRSVMSKLKEQGITPKKLQKRWALKSSRVINTTPKGRGMNDKP